MKDDRDQSVLSGRTLEQVHHLLAAMGAIYLATFYDSSCKMELRTEKEICRRYGLHGHNFRRHAKALKKEGWVAERNSLLLHYKQVAYEALYREQYEDLLWSVWHTVKLLDGCRKRSAAEKMIRTYESEYPLLADRLEMLIPSVKTITSFRR